MNLPTVYSNETFCNFRQSPMVMPVIESKKKATTISSQILTYSSSIIFSSDHLVHNLKKVKRFRSSCEQRLIHEHSYVLKRYVSLYTVLLFWNFFVHVVHKVDHSLISIIRFLSIHILSLSFLFSFIIIRFIEPAETLFYCCLIVLSDPLASLLIHAMNFTAEWTIFTSAFSTH